MIAPGIWPDATPSGKWAYAGGGAIQTSDGVVPNPLGSDGVLYLRVTDAFDPVAGRRVFKLCGQVHSGPWKDHAVLWDGAWHDEGLAYGVSPVEFDDAGTLRRWPHQGIRWIDGSGETARIWTGDATIADFTLELSEFTRRGSVTIGMSRRSDDGGRTQRDWCVAVTPRGRFVLHAAPVRGIRFHDEDRLAVTFWTLATPHQVHIRLMTLAELEAYPHEPPSTIVAPPPPPPPPPPEDPMSVPDRSAEAAAFLTPRLWWVPSDHAVTMAATFGAVNALCLRFRETDPRWFLLVKDSHNANVRLRGVDVLLYKISETEAQVVDVVGDSDGHDGPPHPTWQLKDIRPISQARMPFLDDEPEPPPDDELDDARRRIAELEARVRELEARPRVAYTYDEMMAFKDRIVAVYREGSLGREQGDMPSATYSHLLWRWIVEGYSEAELVEDARRRGNGDVPD